LETATGKGMLPATSIITRTMGLARSAGRHPYNE